MTKRGGLGKGLNALIPKETARGEEQVTQKRESQLPDGTGPSRDSYVEIDVILIEPNKDQPRKNFNEDALEELSESIREHGVMAPILVVPKKGRYEIIAGERRWRAARKAGLKTVPAIIRKDLTDQEITELSLIENIQRENLNPIEEAMAYKRLLTDFHMKQDEVAARVSKSRTAVTNSMRLLKLTDQVRQMVIEEKLSTGHARALIPVEDPDRQIELAEKVFDEKLSVRDTERLIRNYGKPKKEKKPTDEQILVIYQELENRCKEAVQTKVEIQAAEKGKGKIIIDFYSNDDLERLTGLLLGRR